MMAQQFCVRHALVFAALSACLVVTCARTDIPSSSNSSGSSPSNQTDTESETESALDLTWLSPEETSGLENPVTFEWTLSKKASRVELTTTSGTQLFEKTDPATSGSATHDFGEDGFEGEVKLTAASSSPGDDKTISKQLDVMSRDELEKGSGQGAFEISYYYVAVESNHPDGDGATLYDDQCKPIVDVSVSFAEAACIEGTGKLEDDRLVNFASRCDCGHPCPTSGDTICYRLIDREGFPWGQGARRNPLDPFRSIAVDPEKLDLMQWVYLPAFDGLEIETDVKTMTHDGCFRTDDTGGAIKENRIDIFTGTEPAWRYMAGIFSTGKELQLYMESPKCWRHSN
jgi:3D (Asp-Asp-Asp) domain-containing protein